MEPITSPRRFLLLFAVAHAWASYTGPFTRVTSNGLAGSSDLAALEGPDDHLFSCGGSLNYLEIDQGAVALLRSTDGGSTWQPNAVDAGAPCADGTVLADKDAGYTATVSARDPSGAERVLVVGGDDVEKNTFFSTDCGLTFSCLDSYGINAARRFSVVIDAPWNSSSHVLMLGGLAAGDTLGRGVFETFDGGLNWQRPACADPDPKPDPRAGGCNFGNGKFQLPQTPAFSGSVAAVDGALYFWRSYNGGDELYLLDGDTYGTGFLRLPGADTGNALGRKAWIGGSVSGGCLFSTDFSGADVFTDWNSSSPSSAALFSVAPSPMGPWSAPAAAPWPARVAPAMVGFNGGSSLLIAGGLCMEGRVAVPCVDPAASDGTWGDAWVVDAGVCLIDPGFGAPCAGHAAPDLATVSCPCPAAWAGDATCGTCGDGFAGGDCSRCALAGHAGPSCAPCAPCSHGTCSGEGSTSGSGACACDEGWAGAACDAPAGGGGGGGAAAAGRGGGLSGGAAFGVTLLVIVGVAGALALFPAWGVTVLGVKVLPGAAVRAGSAAAWRAAQRAAAGAVALARTAGSAAGGSGGESEKAALLRAQPARAAAPATPAATAPKLGAPAAPPALKGGAGGGRQLSESPFFSKDETL